MSAPSERLVLASKSAARRAMLALPYYYHFDDQFFCMFPAKGTGLENPDFLLRNWRLELEAQYARGRCFSMVLHPQHMGFAHRLEMLVYRLRRKCQQTAGEPLPLKTVRGAGYLFGD